MRAVTLSLALFFSGVATADAPDHNSPLPVNDVGTELQNDPFSNDIGLTKGNIAKFMKVYVDPSSFPGTLQPIAPLPVPQPTSISPIAPGERGEGRTIKLVVANHVPQGAITGESLLRALTEQEIGTVTFDGDRTFTIVIGEEGLNKAFSFALGPVKKQSYRLQDLGELSILVEPATNASAATPTWEPLEVSAPPMPSAKGGQLLKVFNDRSGWADVKVNGELVARISPYGNGEIHGVAPGVYEVNFTVSSGYSWTREVATTGK